MRFHCNIMRKDLKRLDHGHRLLSPHKRFEHHRCEPVSAGFMLERDPERYQFDNATRESFCLFQYTLSGEGRFADSRTGEVTVMTPGMGFLSAMPEPTRYWLDPGCEWEFIFLLYVGDMARYYTERAIVEHGHIIACAETSRPVDLVCHFLTSADNGGRLDKYRASSWLFQLLMELSRLADTPPGPVPDALRLAVAHAESTFANPAVGVDDLAEAAGYSKYHFSRLFKHHLGVSPYAYLQELRLREAMARLTESDAPAKQIAFDCGFRDYPYFCHAFKKHFGFTPGTVRREREHFRA